MFQVVSWPPTDLPNPGDPGTDPAVAALLIRSAVFWTLDANGYGQPGMETIDRITGERAVDPHPVSPSADADTDAGDAPVRAAEADGFAVNVDAVFDRRRRARGTLQPWASHPAA